MKAREYVSKRLGRPYVEEDARVRVVQARTGSLDRRRVTAPYLRALRRGLLAWIEVVEEEMVRLEERNRRRDDAP